MVGQMLIYLTENKRKKQIKNNNNLCNQIRLYHTSFLFIQFKIIKNELNINKFVKVEKLNKIEHEIVFPKPPLKNK